MVTGDPLGEPETLLCVMMTSIELMGITGRTPASPDAGLRQLEKCRHHKPLMHTCPNADANLRSRRGSAAPAPFLQQLAREVVLVKALHALPEFFVMARSHPHYTKKLGEVGGAVQGRRSGFEMCSTGDLA